MIMGSSNDWRKKAIISVTFASLVVVIFVLYCSKLRSREFSLQPPTSAKKLNTLQYQDDKFSDVRARQQRRKALLAEICEKHFPGKVNNKLEYPKMLSSDNQRFLYCIIPKICMATTQVACTSWKHVLLQANGAPEDINVHAGRIHLYVDLIWNLRPNAQRLVLNKYFKFVFVRHPFERLVSAHQDKFLDREPAQWESFGKEIIREYRTEEQRGNDRPTFREFVRHVIDPKRRLLNRHWRPYHELCQPCRIGFDFIGHYETMADDARYVLDRLRIQDQFPFYSDTRKHNSSGVVAARLAQLSDYEFRRLVDVFRLDFAMFGYSPNISVHSSAGDWSDSLTGLVASTQSTSTTAGTSTPYTTPSTSNTT